MVPLVAVRFRLHQQFNQYRYDNDIDKDCYVDVYYKGELIGRCENELALLDIRVQIARGKFSGYSVKFKDEVIRIDKNGNLESYPDWYVGFLYEIIVRISINKKIVSMKTVEKILESESALRITTSGEITEITPKDGKHFSIEEMYEHCGCDIVEFVYLPNNKIMVCDEEGLLKSDLKKNELATDIYHSVGGHPLHPITGNVMIILDSQTE